MLRSQDNRPTQCLQELAPIVLLDEAGLGPASRKADPLPAKAPQTAEVRHARALDESLSMTRRHAIDTVSERMQCQSATFSSRGIFPVNVNSLRARGAARVAIKSMFAPTARREVESQSGGAATTVHGTSEEPPQFRQRDLHMLSPESPTASGRLPGFATSECNYKKRRSTMFSCKSACTSVHRHMVATSPSATHRMSTSSAYPHQDGKTIMLSTPSAVSPSSPTHTVTTRRSRPGNHSMRGHVQGRASRVSTVGFVGPGSRMRRVTARSECQSVWHPPTIALQQELAQRREGHVEKYRSRILDAVSPTSLLQELGINPSQADPGPNLDGNRKASENLDRDAHGDLPGGEAPGRDVLSRQTTSQAQASQSLELTRMIDAAREALATAALFFKENGTAGVPKNRLTGIVSFKVNCTGFQRLQQMFASGQPSSEKRTTLLLRMIRDTVEAVNEQLANIGGRRKKAGRPGRALDSLSSFASVSRAQQAYNAHEAGVVAAADACRGWEGGDGDWALGIGVLPATDGSCIRAAPRLVELPTPPSSAGGPHDSCTGSDLGPEASFGSGGSAHRSRRAPPAAAGGAVGSAQIPRGSTFAAAGAPDCASPFSKTLNPRKATAIDATKGDDLSHGNINDKAGSDSDSDNSESGHLEEEEAVDELPSAMHVLRRAGVAVKEPSKNPMGAPVSSKRVAKEMRALLGTLANLTPQDFVNARGAPLPPPPAEIAGDAVTCMQWRVQRIWASLQIPALQQLDMLTTFADMGFGDELSATTDAWEEAIAAVAAREGILVALSEINLEGNKDEPCTAKLKDCVAKSRALLAATEHVEEAAQHLHYVTGHELTLAGEPYPPPGALRKAQLSEFCTRILRRASEVG